VSIELVFTMYVSGEKLVWGRLHEFAGWFESFGGFLSSLFDERDAWILSCKRGSARELRKQVALLSKFPKQIQSPKTTVQIWFEFATNSWKRFLLTVKLTWRSCFRIPFTLSLHA
jgi:hypothetical protein